MSSENVLALMVLNSHSPWIPSKHYVNGVCSKSELSPAMIHSGDPELITHWWINSPPNANTNILRVPKQGHPQVAMLTKEYSNLNLSRGATHVR